MTALVSRIIVPSVYRNDQRVPTANNFMIALRLLGTQTQIVDLSKSNWAPEELTYTIYVLIRRQSPAQLFECQEVIYFKLPGDIFAS